MPLTLALNNKKLIIKKIQGNKEIKHRLQELGFIPDAEIIKISHNGENIIVNIKDTRIAISKDIANKIIVL